MCKKEIDLFEYEGFFLSGLFGKQTGYKFNLNRSCRGVSIEDTVITAHGTPIPK
jgi:hypothetical protein